MQRHFDPERVDQIRRARRIEIKTVGAELGLSGPTVSPWFSGKTTPTPEKLPALAAALGGDIDELFPRMDENGNRVEPDLKDLRDDAGIPMKAIPEIIKTATPVPVRRAESGKKRLDETFAELLAPAYGVTVAELRAAEDRSFGNSPTAGQQRAMPSTLAGKITYHLELLPADARPSDADIAAAVNARAGRPVIIPDQALALRTGAMSQEDILDQVPEPILHQGLADVFNVPAVTFQSSDEMVDHLVEVVQALAGQGNFELQARGGERGISPRMAAKLKELAALVKAESRPKRSK
ncbi:helix-turn-helix domain-containing protein [Streptomyces sp. NPDC093589]|uniref:helix-turn-helix domain-containing protein n=1 Tax=Streptomyces sp. NPDC093589 TaxID=3366043 RepID=UPI003815519D